MSSSLVADPSSIPQIHCTVLCALIADGDDEEEGICECERGEVRQLQSCTGEYNVSGLRV